MDANMDREEEKDYLDDVIRRLCIDIDRRLGPMPKRLKNNKLVCLEDQDSWYEGRILLEQKIKHYYYCVGFGPKLIDRIIVILRSKDRSLSERDNLLCLLAVIVSKFIEPCFLADFVKDFIVPHGLKDLGSPPFFRSRCWYFMTRLNDITLPPSRANSEVEVDHSNDGPLFDLTDSYSENFEEIIHSIIDMVRLKKEQFFIRFEAFNFVTDSLIQFDHLKRMFEPLAMQIIKLAFELTQESYLTSPGFIDSILDLYKITEVQRIELVELVFGQVDELSKNRVSIPLDDDLIWNHKEWLWTLIHVCAENKWSPDPIRALKINWFQIILIITRSIKIKDTYRRNENYYQSMRTGDFSHYMGEHCDYEFFSICRFLLSMSSFIVDRSEPSRQWVNEFIRLVRYVFKCKKSCSNEPRRWLSLTIAVTMHLYAKEKFNSIKLEEGRDRMTTEVQKICIKLLRNDMGPKDCQTDLVLALISSWFANPILGPIEKSNMIRHILTLCIELGDKLSRVRKYVKIGLTMGIFRCMMANMAMCTDMIGLKESELIELLNKYIDFIPKYGPELNGCRNFFHKSLIDYQSYISYLITIIPQHKELRISLNNLIDSLDKIDP